jgi:hypothetical protein
MPNQIDAVCNKLIDICKPAAHHHPDPAVATYVHSQLIKGSAHSRMLVATIIASYEHLCIRQRMSLLDAFPSLSRTVCKTG